MPEKGSRPEWERENNRKQIIYTLLENSLTFTELLNETGLARSTLSNHLKELQELQIIEKAIENGRVVYRTMLDEDTIESELKSASFDLVLKMMSSAVPGLGLFVKFVLKLGIKTRILNRRLEIEGKPALSESEFMKVMARDLAESMSKEDIDREELFILIKALELVIQEEKKKEGS